MQKRNYEELPEGYKEILEIDLDKNKKQKSAIFAISMLTAIVLYIAGLFLEHGPYSSNPFGFSKMAVAVIGTIIYMLLHEAVHGIAMKYYGTKNVRFGHVGLQYLFAASDDWYEKTAYIVISLAPVVVFGVLFALLCAIVPDDWFWAVYIIQIMNLSGAAGDFYVTIKFLGLPSDILVRDWGVSMKVYGKE